MVKSRTSIRLSRFAAGVATMAAVACATQGTSENTRSTRQALWTNGGFESSDAGDTQPTGWTITTNLDPGITVQTPQTLIGLNLAAGGVLESSVVGGAQDSQTDPDVTAVTFPKYGTRTLRLNYLSPALNGTNQNVNSADQSMTIAPGDVDPVDGKVHVRFVILPILQNPGHSASAQPYYFVELTNTTKSNAILYQDFNYSNYPGVPWKAGAPSGALYTDWQLVDVAPGSAQLAIGDTVDLRIIASGCAAGGHWGRVYVDGVGSTIPGPFVSATGPQAQNAGANITYTFNYRNGGTASALASSIAFTTPANTTFVSASIPGCTGVAAAATGTETCALGDVPVGGTGTLQITVAIDALTAAGTVITNGNYEYLATGVSPLLGPKVSTTVTSGVMYADLSLTETDGVAAVGWGLPVTYTIVAANAGPSAVTGATVTDTLPAQLTGATWTCVASAGAACAATGTGSIADATVGLPAGGSVTYTVNATVVAGTGSGTLNNIASVTVPAAAVDPDTTNNAAGDTDDLGTVRTLTLTKNGAQVGAIASVPASLVCGVGCATATGSFLDGSTVILNETPAAGWTFQGWTGPCLAAGTASTCTFTMTGDQAVGATFFGPPATATVSGGGTQATGVGLAFTAPITLTVKDALGDPLPGVTVTFTAPASGASATLGSGGVVVTDTSGVATLTATANATPGPYNVTATVVGVATPVTFALENFGPPATVTVATGSSQSATVTTAFGLPLSVTVLDAVGDPVPGVTVTFATPAAGASATLGTSATADASATATSTAVTDAGGKAQLTATANAVAGSYDVTATVGGVATAASFSLTNVAEAIDSGTADAAMDGGIREQDAAADSEAPEAASDDGGPIEMDATMPGEPVPPGDQEGSVTGGGLSCSASSGPSAPASGAALLLGFVGLAVFGRGRRRR